MVGETSSHEPVLSFLEKLLWNNSSGAPVPIPTKKRFVGIVTTQSVPDLVTASSTYSFMIWSCISTALTASPVDGVHADWNTWLFATTTLIGGEADSRLGVSFPAPVYSFATEKLSIATASAVKSVPALTLINVMPPINPPVGGSASLSPRASVCLEQPGGTPLTWVTLVCVVELSAYVDISMISAYPSRVRSSVEPPPSMPAYAPLRNAIVWPCDTASGSVHDLSGLVRAAPSAVAEIAAAHTSFGDR